MGFLWAATLGRGHLSSGSSANRCPEMPAAAAPSKQDPQGLRVPGEDPGHADPLSVSEKAERAGLLSPPARPGSFTGPRPASR